MAKKTECRQNKALHLPLFRWRSLAAGELGLLVRRAQLGASCGVPRTLSFPGSPNRAKPDQQPVPSVAPVAESFKSGTG
jgi:hypothetical protein